MQTTTLMTMTKSVWVFPGQGSQAVGMGEDLAAAAKDKFAEAEIGRASCRERV